MKRRCLNPRTPNFKYYGALGVQVCDQWLTDFGAFLAEVGLRPSPRHSLDRWPNSHGNYEPGNVRWATRSEQEQNKVFQDMVMKLNAVVAQYATQNGYAVVLDVSNQQSPILWAAASTDITNDIVKLYDQAHPVAAGAPAAKPPAPPATKKQ